MTDDYKKWESRIVGYGDESPDQLMAHPKNFRIHPRVQQAALSGSLDTLGWIAPVIVSKNSGAVVDGHLRVSLAIREKQPTVPVVYVDLSPEEEAQALLSLDPIAALAGTDKGKLDELLRQVQTDDANVMQYLTDLAEKNGIGIDLVFDAFDGAGDGGGSQISDGTKLRVVIGPIMMDIDDASHEMYRRASEIGAPSPFVHVACRMGVELSRSTDQAEYWFSAWSHKEKLAVDATRDALFSTGIMDTPRLSLKYNTGEIRTVSEPGQ